MTVTHEGKEYQWDEAIKAAEEGTFTDWQRKGFMASTDGSQTAHYASLLRRIRRFIELYKELPDTAFPAKVQVLDHCSTVFTSRQDIESRLKELIELVGIDVCLEFSEEGNGMVVKYNLNAYFRSKETEAKRWE